MGSHKEDKEGGRRRSRSTSSDSSEERRHKKAKKEHKHKHKHKYKKHKKHGGEVDEQQLAAAKALLEQHLQATGGQGGSAAAALAAAAAAGGGASSSRGRGSKEKPAGQLPLGVPLLTQDDYFARSPEFTDWLQTIRGQFFNELSSQQTHEAFKAFVADWNSGQLPLRFYTGLAAAPIKRTSHEWGFKAPPQQQQGRAGGRAAAAGVGRTGMAAFLEDQKEQAVQGRALASADRRKAAREQRDLLNELAPKATAGTHEARVEARVARRAEARAREDSPDLVAAGGIMGGDDSFAAAKAREAKRQDWRAKQQVAKQEQLATKLSAAAAAEADKMAQFRALVAAQGGKITIAKRQ